MDHKEITHLLGEPPINEDDAKKLWLRFNLTNELVSIHESQFQRTKNTEKWDHLENDTFPFFCRLAEIHGGYAELDINEDTLVAKLAYTDSQLILSNADGNELKKLSDILITAENVYISSEGKFFKILLTFYLYDKVKIADYSTEIQERKEEMKRLYKNMDEMFFQELLGCEDCKSKKRIEKYF